MSLPLILLVGGGYALSKLFALDNAGKELSISVGDVGVSKIENMALKLWAEVWYDNFTGTALHIQQPTVKIFLNDSTTEIGHAIPSTAITDVPAHGRNEKPATIQMLIPLSNIVFAIPALIAGEKANRKILIQIKCEVNGFTYKSEKVYTI
jgi:hypothetical protein